MHQNRNKFWPIDVNYFEVASVSPKHCENFSMSSKQANELILITSNYVRINYEKKYNTPDIPMALKYIIIKYANKIIGCKLLSFQQDIEFSKLLTTKLSNLIKFKLLYRSSDHNFSTEKFHKLCDIQGPTITIIQSSHNTIFGGYTSVSWQSDKLYNYVADHEAFLFVIHYDHKYRDKKSDGTDKQLVKIMTPLIFKPKTEREQWSVFHSKSHGPSFGAGPDFQLNDNQQGIANCMPWSYNYGKIREITLPRFKKGNDQFRYIDYEVIKVILE